MINWEQIKQLEEDVGAEDLADVVELFLAEVDEAIGELDKIATGSPPEVAAALHFLKGSAYNLGFREFAEYCGKGEAQAQGGAIHEISFKKVEQLYGASKTIFLAEISNHCSVVL